MRMERVICRVLSMLLMRLRMARMLATADHSILRKIF